MCPVRTSLWLATLALQARDSEPAEYCQECSSEYLGGPRQCRYGMLARTDARRTLFARSVADRVAADADHAECGLALGTGAARIAETQHRASWCLCRGWGPRSRGRLSWTIRRRVCVGRRPRRSVCRSIRRRLSIGGRLRWGIRRCVRWGIGTRGGVGRRSRSGRRLCGGIGIGRGVGRGPRGGRCLCWGTGIRGGVGRRLSIGGRLRRRFRRGRAAELAMDTGETRITNANTITAVSVLGQHIAARTLARATAVSVHRAADPGDAFAAERQRHDRAADGDSGKKCPDSRCWQRLRRTCPRPFGAHTIHDSERCVSLFPDEQKRFFEFTTSQRRCGGPWFACRPRHMS
jgi:hypothetical protein